MCERLAISVDAGDPGPLGLQVLVQQHQVGPRAGRGMRRGSLLLGRAPDLVPDGFASCGAADFVMLLLIARRVPELAAVFGGGLSGRAERLVGDRLSGGERALTVISILFAFLAYRPAPFCVVDEIDSALDEANVRRFSEFLTEYSKRSQFIVVTHRKGTMEAADILHGVTMEDSGVSRLVSVKFTEDGKPKEEERMMRGTI